MNSIPVLNCIPALAEQRTHLLQAALVLVGAVAVASFILVPQLGLLVVIGCAALWFVGMVGDAFRGRLDGILLCYALAFPFSYCLLSFPQERSIVTLDRVVILVAFVGLFLVKPSTRMGVPKSLRWAGFVWFVFVAIAGVSLGRLRDLHDAHILFDGFLLPLLLGWCVIARFDVRRRLPTMHTAVCISSIMCAVIAAAEIVTGQDLFPSESTPMYFAGSLPRPNGPFESDYTLATVGAISFFFLLFLRAALGPKLRPGRRMLHSIGLAATIGMALMPMFRSVAITLLLALFIDTFWEQRTTRRAWRVVLMLSSAGLIFIAPLFAPKSVVEDRSNPGNVYSRVAEFEASLRVIADHPVLGVGFANFGKFVVGEPRYVTSYEGVYSVDTPHNNLTQIFAETGILGFVPYFMAQVLLFKAIWQLRQSSSSGYLAWKYYVYLFLSFWITGLTESSGYSPLNLWYVFVVTICCKYALSDPDLMQPAEVQVPDEAFSVPFSDDQRI
jgi:hypothetical protein